MIIQDKKIKEFSEIMQNPKAKLLLITGPPGCGKNSLVNLYCKHNNV
jgi:ATP-dependent Lon protease